MDNNPDFKLGLLVAYYPTAIPEGKLPNAISALVHLPAGRSIGVTKQSQMVGIQGKRRTRQKRVDPGLGTGGKLQLDYPTYTYNAETGFAEHDVEEYDGVSAELAWSRSLRAARKVFGIDPDLELVLESNLQSKRPCEVRTKLISQVNSSRMIGRGRPRHSPHTRRLMSRMSLVSPVAQTSRLTTPTGSRIRHPPRSRFFHAPSTWIVSSMRCT